MTISTPNHAVIDSTVDEENPLANVLATGQTVVPPMTCTEFNDGGDY